MLTKTIYSTYDGNPVFIINIEKVGESAFNFQIKSAADLNSMYNFKYNDQVGLQPNGDNDSKGDWYDVIYWELNLLVGRIKGGEENLDGI